MKKVVKTVRRLWGRFKALFFYTMYLWTAAFVSPFGDQLS
jgi:hypothetical protein